MIFRANYVHAVSSWKLSIENPFVSFKVHVFFARRFGDSFASELLRLIRDSIGVQFGLESHDFREEFFGWHLGLEQAENPFARLHFSKDPVFLLGVLDNYGMIFREAGKVDFLADSSLIGELAIKVALGADGILDSENKRVRVTHVDRQSAGLGVPQPHHVAIEEGNHPRFAEVQDRAPKMEGKRPSFYSSRDGPTDGLTGKFARSRYVPDKDGRV